MVHIIRYSRNTIEHNGKPQDTKARLVRTATELFAKRWVSVVSVADICRSAGLSNGVFYRYFRSKETILREIVEAYLDDLSASLAAIAVGDPRAVFAEIVRVLLDTVDDDRERYMVFREAQYRFPEYETRMRSVLIYHVEQALGRTCTSAESIYALSGVRFSVFRRAFNAIEVDPDDLVRMVFEGVFAVSAGEDFDRVFDIAATLNPVKLIQSSRDRLLKSGRGAFGSRGFHDVNIHEITDAVGMASGTFYNYFSGKDDFYREIIEGVNHDVRAFIERNLDHQLSRIAREIQGMWLFAFYVARDPTAYNLVREAEFVLPASVKEYYDHFERGYWRGLIEVGNFHVKTMIAFLMGISHYFGMEILFEQSLPAARALLEELGTLLHTGITVETQGVLATRGRKKKESL